MKCFVDKPYPPIKVTKANKEYAKLLLKNYAGQISEDTAIHLYMYQSLVCSDEDLAKTLKDIAIVEMHHLEMLGELITLLGVKPVYGTIKNDYFKPWTSTNVNYNICLKNMLEIDIKNEEIAIKNYKENINCIDDIFIINILERIIEDEVLHIKIFKYYYPKITS